MLLAQNILLSVFPQRELKKFFFFALAVHIGTAACDRSVVEVSDPRD